MPENLYLRITLLFYHYNFLCRMGLNKGRAGRRGESLAGEFA